MSERKIVVPEGMLKATLDANKMPHTPPFIKTVRLALEAALRWLSDNPIVPTDEDRKMFLKMGFGYSASDWSHYQARAYLENAGYAMVEWQRRMFLAPEPELSPAAQRILSAAQGSTFTPEEYKAIEYSVRTATHGLIDAAK